MFSKLKKVLVGCDEVELLEDLYNGFSSEWKHKLVNCAELTDLADLEKIIENVVLFVKRINETRDIIERLLKKDLKKTEMLPAFVSYDIIFLSSNQEILKKEITDAKYLISKITNDLKEQ